MVYKLYAALAGLVVGLMVVTAAVSAFRSIAFSGVIAVSVGLAASYALSRCFVRR